MKKLFSYCILYSFFITFSYAQDEKILVAELTIKVPGLGEETKTYGFAEGDKIVINIEEVNGKELKVLEVIEYPSNVKFSEYKTAKLENKRIAVNKTAVYQFKIKNSSTSKRICKIRIERIPSSPETIDFNTDYVEKTIYDTIWNTYQKDFVIGYDKIEVPYTKKVLDRADTTIMNLIAERNERVHSLLDIKSRGNYAYIDVTLPQSIKNFNEESEVYSWAYFIGAGQQGIDAFKDATRVASNIGSTYLKTLPGYGPLAALCLNAVSNYTINSPVFSENIKYTIQGFQYGNPFQIDAGNVISTFGKNFNYKQGTVRLYLENDNQTIPVNVRIDFTAVIIKKTYKQVTEYSWEERPIKETRTIKEPKVTSKKILVNAN